MNKKIKNNNKCLKKVVYLIFCIISIILVVHSFSINKKYPSFIENKSKIGEKFEVNDLTVSVTSYNIYNQSQFAEKYPYCNKHGKKDYDLIVVLNVVNNTSNIKSLPLDHFLLEYNGWSSNINIKNFYLLNDWTTTYNIAICGGDSANIILPYTYYSLEDTKETPINSTQLNLSYYINYPHKYLVDLGNL